jgi:hypothetical protein
MDESSGEERKIGVQITYFLALRAVFATNPRQIDVQSWKNCGNLRNG